MTTLAELANAAMQNLTVQWLPIKLMSTAGTAWNVGEYALAYVQITNTTGLTLRNVAIETSISGSAAQYQPCGSWDGNGGFISELEPGQVWKNYCAKLKAFAPGTISMTVYVTAEVVPLGTATPHVTSFDVWPS